MEAKQRIVLEYVSDVSGLSSAEKAIVGLTNKEEQLVAAIDEVNKVSKTQAETLKEAGETGAAGMEKTARATTSFRGSLRQALGDVQVFGVSMNGIGENARNLGSAFQTGAKGVTGFGGALKLLVAIPIVLLLTGIIVVLTKTEKGMEFVERATAAVGAAFNVLVDAAATLGEALITLFEDPTKLITDFGGTVDNLTKGFDNLGIKMVAAGAAAAELEGELQDLEDRQRNINLLNAEAEQQVTRLILQAKNRSLSEAERLALLDQASAIETEAFNRQLKQEQKMLEIIQRRNKINQVGSELLDSQKDEEVNQQIKITQLETESLNLQERIANRRAILIEEQRAREAKYMEEKRKGWDIEMAQSLTYSQILQRQIDEEKRIRTEFEAFLKSQNLRLISLDNERTESEREKALRRIRFWIDENQEKVAIIRQGADVINSIYSGILDGEIMRNESRLEALTDAQSRELELAGDNAKAREMIERDFATQKKAIEREIAEDKRRQAILSKVLAIADIGINTAKAVIKAVSESPLTFGLPWSAVVAGLGIAQAGVVASTPIPKYAVGVESVPGFGTDTSDNVLAWLSPRERVVTAKDNRLYGPTLSAIHNHKIPAAELNEFVEQYGQIGRLSLPEYSGGSAAVDLNPLISEMRQFKQALENQPQYQTIIDENGFNTYQQRGNTRTQYLNSRRGR